MQPASSQTITFEELKELNDNHAQSAAENETLSVWYAAEDIINLLKDNSATGLRIYIGRYNAQNETYPGKLTVMPAATYNVESGDNNDLVFDETETDINEEVLSALGHGLVCPPRCRP